MYLRRYLFLILVLVTLPLGAAPAAAAGFVKVGLFSFNWEGERTGARLTALGGADIAGEQGPEVVLVNPAPLGTGTGAVAAYSRLDNFIVWDDVDLESYAVAGGWEALRVTFCRVGYGKDGFIVRTAYEPEGGEYSSYLNSMTVLGLSWEAARRWLRDTPWRLAVGVSQRHYRADLMGRVTSADGWDVGATLGWETHFSGGGLRISGAWSKQNVSGATVDYGVFLTTATAVPLPEPWRGGVSARVHADWPALSRELVALLVAYTHMEHVGDYPYDADQYGVELILGGALAVRYGRDNDRNTEPESWGLGLVLDERFMGPMHARIHWARLKYDTIYIDDRDL